MAGGFLSLCVLAVLSGYLQAQEISEHDLYVTQSWRSDSRAVVVRAQENVVLMEQWLEDTNIPVSQVKCEASSGSELCRLLSTNVAVVRKNGRVLVGVDKESINNNTVASVMENLFGPEFHLIEDYTAMKEFQDGHPQHMLVYARSYREAAFENYLYFLKALLSVPDRPTHVAVTKQPLALPLSQRPKFSKTAELFIWLVSDGKWCQYSNSSHPFHIVGGIAAFYNRIKIPFKLRYMSDQLTSEYQDKGLFTAYVIHSPANKKLAERVVGDFIGTYCNFFVFLIVEKTSRKNRLTQALYLSAGENNIIVIEPPVTDMPPIHLNLLGIEEQDMLTMLAPIQEEYTQQYMANPETGKPVKRRRKVVLTDPRTIGYLAVDAQEDMLVAFCDEKDQQVCAHFENSIQKVADIITTSMYQKQEIGFSLVRCSSLEEVQRYGVDDFPQISYYNVSDGRWSEVQEHNFQEIIQRALGKPEESEEEMALRKEGEKVFEEEQRKFLKEDNTPDKKKLREADKKSREYSEDPPRPPQETTPPPEQQQQQQQPPPDQPPAASTPSSNNIQSRAVVEEDDHFGQLSFSLGTPEYPEELTLSDESFGVHINSYSTTMVTFYVPWEPHCDGVMHYMLQAMDDLPEGSDSSMAVVNCADYPDLCSSYGIVTYPTVLLFRASPNDWIPYKGMMDSRQMLKALLHQQAEDTTEHGLVTHNYRWNL
ncbi:hypothetical protein GBAR_LOCUS4962 [Geodia barretti]|uniref:Thioredoxin domain-containing protein n=2 Tax=Geodia barretti TaxID=519541 RepID=A0AA35R8R3_GEOBA|nr:hypothetical protein GBAR_LOCUS4962 [Geodia barretti]